MKNKQSKSVAPKKEFVRVMVVTNGKRRFQWIPAKEVAGWFK